MDVRMKYNRQWAEIGREADPPKDANNYYYYTQLTPAARLSGSQDLTGAESLDWCRLTLRQHGWDLDTATRSALNMPTAAADRPEPPAEVRGTGGSRGP